MVVEILRVVFKSSHPHHTIQIKQSTKILLIKPNSKGLKDTSTDDDKSLKNLNCETYDILKSVEKIETQLKRLKLYNTTYLHKRNDIYYFSIRVGKLVIRKSLHTYNKTFAIILKMKILRALNMNNINPTTVFTMNNEDIEKLLTLRPNNDIEEKLMPELRKVIRRAIKRLKKEYGYDIGINDVDDEVSETECLSDYTTIFLSDIENSTSKKTMIKFRQAIDYLHIYFLPKYNIRKMKKKDAVDFRRFLRKVPKNWKQKKELKDKNIKVMIDKKAKILDKYDKQMESTINEVMKRVITIFDAFAEETLIYENHFAKLTTKKLPSTKKREYTVKEFKAIFDYYDKEYSQEEYNFIKFLLFTGLRRNEALSITKVNYYK